MTSTILENIIIEERQTINGNQFFMIQDCEKKNAYFCFQSNLKNIWKELVTNWFNIEKVAIEYEELAKGNKVTNLTITQLADEVFV